MLLFVSSPHPVSSSSSSPCLALPEKISQFIGKGREISRFIGRWREISQFIGRRKQSIRRIGERMGEEARDDYDLELLEEEEDEEEDRVMEWETGLPGSDELTPLSQPLVPPGLAAAFRIAPEPGRTLLDVHRASAATVSRLRRASSSSSSFPTFHQKDQESAAAARGESNTNSNMNSNSSKRPRLVWTPQLHKRFVDVVAHLGIKNAVPKTIMQLMNVEGLTRENVASHLQKYRLYVKRMQGLSNEGPSPSDHIFASTPVPHALVHEVPAPYHYVGMMPINHHNGSNGFHGGGGAATASYATSSYQYHK